jgi:hypothetical protein
MATIKTSDLSGKALDYAVAQCVGKKKGYAHHLLAYEELDLVSGVAHSLIQRYSPSTNWAQGGPIIERELLEVSPHFKSASMEKPQGVWVWKAYVLGPLNIDDSFEQEGESYLVAAMRCFVASKLGDSVEIPDELLKA